MKRTLLLAGCLVLLTGCAKKSTWSAPAPPGKATITVTPQNANGPEKCIGSDGRSTVPCITYAGPTDSAGTLVVSPVSQQEGTDMQICTDKEGNWFSCLMPMVAPTMHDVVTHHAELSCPKGYEEWQLEGPYAGGWTLTTIEDSEMIPICVTPAFIAELKKANGEK